MVITRGNWFVKGTFVLAISALAVPFLTGCGQATRSVSPAAAPDGAGEIVPMVSREQRLSGFDKTFSDIKDKSSAQNAVVKVTGHILGEGGLGSQGLSPLSENLLNKLISAELRARNLSSGLSPSEVDGESGYSTEKVASAINAASGQNVVSEKEVEDARSALRQEMPHIKGVDVTKVTPLEAMMTGYVLATGDQGVAPAGAYKERFPDSKISAFVENLVE